jgi:DNA-binding MarR family transcriptional regulator
MDDQIIATCMRITNKIIELEKIPQEYRTGQALYPSEIHTIQAIGDNGLIRVGDLAHTMGVTSGAVSQMVRKLSHKGLVEKKRSCENEKEVFLSLSDHGRIAYNAHDEIHKDIAERIQEKTGRLTEEEYALITRVFNAIEYTIIEMLDNKAHLIKKQTEVQ